jgi:hypothetical protein
MRLGHRILSIAAVLCAGGGCAQPADPAQEPLPGASGGKADNAFGDGPMFMTGAFDGSQGFKMWADTLEFTRQLEREQGKDLHFTYFINTCYYTLPAVRGSAIGTVQSRPEMLARIAITQQAINEGHEIGSHTVLHLNGGDDQADGKNWSVDRWREELTSFNNVVHSTLFRPVLENGRPVFPKWVARSTAPRAAGASCVSGADCDSGSCLPVSDTQKFCTQACNSRLACPSNMACGQPQWTDSKDVCIPLPEFPVVYKGETLFDAQGNANLASQYLKPYDIVGFRAPQLGENMALFDVLTELGFKYDTSQIRPFGPPAKVRYKTGAWNLFELSLMKLPGSASVPMDYNYLANMVPGDRMATDYKNSIVYAYAHNRMPWNIGHHFALWDGGRYWEAMKGAFVFAAQGCPGSAGKQCERVEFPTFRELYAHLQDKTDEAGEDEFSYDYETEDAGNECGGECADAH